MTDQPKDLKSTPEAMRAADRICNLQGWHDFDKSNNPSLRKDLSLVDDLARIIDEETATEHDRLKESHAELLEALKDIILVTKHGGKLATSLKQAQAAIAKANNNKGKNKSMNIECPQCSHSSSKPIQDNKDFRRFSKALFDKDGEHIRSEEWIICLNSECGHEDDQLEFGVTKRN